MEFDESSLSFIWMLCWILYIVCLICDMCNISQILDLFSSWGVGGKDLTQPSLLERARPVTETSSSWQAHLTRILSSHIPANEDGAIFWNFACIKYIPDSGYHVCIMNQPLLQTFREWLYCQYGVSLFCHICCKVVCATKAYIIDGHAVCSSYNIMSQWQGLSSD
jgi:hypothetical protein